MTIRPQCMVLDWPIHLEMIIFEGFILLSYVPLIRATGMGLAIAQTASCPAWLFLEGIFLGHNPGCLRKADREPLTQFFQEMQKVNSCHLLQTLKAS